MKKKLSDQVKQLENQLQLMQGLLDSKGRAFDAVVRNRERAEEKLTHAVECLQRIKGWVQEDRKRLGPGPCGGYDLRCFLVQATLNEIDEAEALASFQEAVKATNGLPQDQNTQG